MRVMVPVWGAVFLSAWIGCNRERTRSRTLDPEPFRVETNCIHFVKWHHLTTGQVSHIAYALTRSPHERAVFRSFGMRNDVMTFQIDGYLERGRQTGGRNVGRLRAVDYRKERLTGPEITADQIEELINKKEFRVAGTEAMTRKHTVYKFCGFTDEEMDRMEERERNMRKEIEKFRAEEGKRFDAFNCSVAGAIVGCEGGPAGLLKPWRLRLKLSDEMRDRYSSVQTALVDLALKEAVAAGRGRVVGEFERIP